MLEAAIFTNVVLGIIQGLTEFLPISSSGHLILAREVLGTVSEADLTFDALLHFATALAIVVYFWRDIRNLIFAAFKLPQRVVTKESLSESEDMVIALIAGTVPAVILGLLLEDIMATLFRNPHLVAGALIAGSLVMLFAEHVRKSRISASEDTSLIGWRKGLFIGLFQSLALIPGMSRSGMTISGGMLFGMGRAEAAKFGFLLGVPLLLGAGAKKAIELGAAELNFAIFAGTGVAFIVALLVIHYLLKFLRNNTLHIFVGYRLLLAIAILFLI